MNITSHKLVLNDTNTTEISTGVYEHKLGQGLPAHDFSVVSAQFFNTFPNINDNYN